MFRFRSSIAALAVLAAGAALPAQTTTPASGQDQTPLFRGGVEVLPLDVTVLDRDGRQVVDLTGDDFTVEVDGKPRRVMTSEYIKMTDALEAGLEIQRAIRHLDLRGEADPYVLSAPVEHTRRYAPHGRFVSITGAGHFAHEEMPDQVNGHVGRFLDQVHTG